MPGQLFFFRDDGILRKINLDEIVVIEATGNYVKLYAAGYSYLIRITMDSLLRQLPKDLFVRIHRSVVCTKIFLCVS
jgi:DNA-binding LytR/AlgR family response regulator